MAPPRLRPLLAAAGFALGLAMPAAAEIYRWTDDQGREHFTMDLHQVPPQHRGEARRRLMLEKATVDPDPAPPINKMETPDAMAVKRALRPRRGSYGSSRARSSPASAASTHCSPSNRERSQKLQRDVVRWQKQVELNQEMERRLVRTEDRLRAENRAEKYEIYLEQAEQALEDFEDGMRQRGVPPGCYR